MPRFLVRVDRLKIKEQLKFDKTCFDTLGSFLKGHFTADFAVVEGPAASTVKDFEALVQFTFHVREEGTTGNEAAQKQLKTEVEAIIQREFGNKRAGGHVKIIDAAELKIEGLLDTLGAAASESSSPASTACYSDRSSSASSSTASTACYSDLSSFTASSTPCLSPVPPVCSSDASSCSSRNVSVVCPIYSDPNVASKTARRTRWADMEPDNETEFYWPDIDENIEAIDNWQVFQPMGQIQDRRWADESREREEKRDGTEDEPHLDALDIWHTLGSRQAAFDTVVAREAPAQACAADELQHSTRWELMAA